METSSQKRPTDIPKMQLAPITQLTPVISHILEETKRSIAWRFDSDGLQPPRDQLISAIREVSTRIGFDLSAFELDELVRHLESDWSPFGLLQPLVDDPQVTDIIVSHFSKITVQQDRKNLRTPIIFPDQQAYEAFVERLMVRAGCTCTTKQPIADGMIGSSVRVHAVHQSICSEGPYLTIRVNRFSSVTIDDLISVGMAPRSIFDYLRAIVRTGRTILLVGEVGTGKTTVARALAAAIPEEESILVIEDTPEIRLSHPHVRYVSTRIENAEGVGRIPPAQCIRAGMRMAMNRIIFGEIRDAEAAEAFIDVCASGHSGLSTMHGRCTADAITRLELFLGRAQRGVERSVLSAQVSTAVQVVVSVEMCHTTGRRRISEVREIGSVADGVLRHRELFRYKCENATPQWMVVTKASLYRESLARESVVLSDLPDTLEPSLEILYREHGRTPQLTGMRRAV